MNEEAQAWFDSRPPKIQALIREFPPGTVLDVKGTPMHVITYDESKDGGEVGLKVTPIDPDMDYEGAIHARIPLCLSHVRSGDVTITHRGAL